MDNDLGDGGAHVVHAAVLGYESHEGGGVLDDLGLVLNPGDEGFVALDQVLIVFEGNGVPLAVGMINRQGGGIGATDIRQEILDLRESHFRVGVE